MGSWSQSPLIMVLAQVRFESFIGWESMAKGFQASIQQDYPRFNEQQILPFNTRPVNVGQSDGASDFQAFKFFEFKNADETKCLRLDSGSLTYTVTEYEQYSDFFEADWIRSLQALIKEHPLYLKRLGLRYVDLFQTKNIESIGEYINPPLASGLGLDGWTSMNRFAVCDYAKDNQKLRVQLFQQRGAPPLPPDIASLQIKKSVLQSLDLEKTSVILDMDRMEDVAGVLSAKDLQDRFLSIHGDLSSAFRTIITNQARQKWGDPKLEQ